jgi:hypothetical protein
MRARPAELASRARWRALVNVGSDARDRTKQECDTTLRRDLPLLVVVAEREAPARESCDGHA